MRNNITRNNIAHDFLGVGCLLFPKIRFSAANASSFNCNGSAQLSRTKPSVVLSLFPAGDASAKLVSSWRRCHLATICRRSMPTSTLIWMSNPISKIFQKACEHALVGPVLGVFSTSKMRCWKFSKWQSNVLSLWCSTNSKISAASIRVSTAHCRNYGI